MKRESALAGQLFSLTDVVNAAAGVVVAKKQAFNSSQNELRAAEAGLQKAQEDLATFIKSRLVTGGA
jgi:hypothetical protein